LLLLPPPLLLLLLLPPAHSAEGWVSGFTNIPPECASVSARTCGRASTVPTPRHVWHARVTPQLMSLLSKPRWQTGPQSPIPAQAAFRVTELPPTALDALHV
jgi:hypothetical protein